jgi:WD40 repeat protein
LKNGAEVQRFSDHEDPVRDLAYSPDGRTAISVEFGALHLWDLGTGDEILRNELPSKGWEVTYTPDGKSALVTLEEEGGVLQVDLATGEQIQRLGGEDQPAMHDNMVDAIAVSPDGKRALSGSQGEQDSLFLWDLESGEAIMSFQTGEVYGVDISPDGKTALSGGLPFEDYVDVMTLWDLESGEALRQFEGHTSMVWEVTYSPDGKMALSGSWDASLILWDLESGEIIHQLLGHTDAVRAAAISPDGRTAVSGSKDGTLILWDLETGEAIRRYHGHTDRVNSVDFSPEGGTVLSGADDGVMIEWRIDDTLEELLDWTQANRYMYELSCAERARYGVEPLCEE